MAGAEGEYPATELHLIGPLQSNKAKEAVALFDAIHSVDRPSLCEALAHEIARQGRAPLLFVEINTGGEPQKSGVLPQDADGFLERCRETYGLAIAGLMCLPPLERAAGAAFRAHRQDRAPQRPAPAVHGNERRFRAGDRVRRHPCAGRHGDFRGAGVGATRLRARALRNVDPRPGSRAGRCRRRKSFAVERDAAGGAGPVRPRHMHEHRAAAAGDARAGVVVELDDEVVEAVVAPEPVAWFIGRPPERPIVAPVGRVFAPGQRRIDAPRRQPGARPRPPIGAPPQAQRAGTGRAAWRRRLRACWPRCRRGRARPGSHAGRPAARRGSAPAVRAAHANERKDQLRHRLT